VPGLGDVHLFPDAGERPGQRRACFFRSHCAGRRARALASPSLKWTITWSGACVLGCVSVSDMTAHNGRPPRRRRASPCRPRSRDRCVVGSCRRLSP
jgi:hypothetical protein